MLTRSHRVQNRQAETEALTRGAAQSGDTEVEGEAPDTKSFLTSLFDSLRVDLQELRWDISQEVRDLRSDLTSLGERVSNIEDSEISRGEEVEQLQQEVLRLREQQEQLQLMAEDLENRSRRHNIRIRGAPQGAEGDNIQEFVTAFTSIPSAASPGLAIDTPKTLRWSLLKPCTCLQALAVSRETLPMC
ncbi:hypothetical protein NDU88_002904 [Pleurodeles waltl]|uniref:Uncharacterized protein n=1 Tax=Pleurodeles waltl TaxID=8319 RepID=A0AAV7M5K3_PLEWA|nr:hypothetical protein NDU88_002904 [Pleurodeles waltl]